MCKLVTFYHTADPGVVLTDYECFFPATAAAVLFPWRVNEVFDERLVSQLQKHYSYVAAA